MADDLEKSFQTLKQTVPLMLKHKVAAVPTNYALWYTYSSNNSPELNEAVDDAISKFHGVSEVRAQELYREHVADKQEVGPWQLRQSIEAMLIELTQTMKDTKNDTAHFKTSVDSSIDDLNKVEQEGWSMDEVMSLVRNMVKETQDVRRTTMAFNASLSKAENEIEKLKEELKKSQQEALYDSLTGLNNRRFFDVELTALAKHKGTCLVLVDIDHFKKFNDTYGHLMGDQVLKAVGKKLQDCCRDGAQAFRFGGEEFAVLVPSSNVKRARHVADVMRRTIEKIRVKDKRTGTSIDGITASFGVAELQPGTHVSQFIEQADKQLYQAKNLGRNRVMPMT